MLKIAVFDLVIRTIVFVSSLIGYFSHVDLAALWQHPWGEDGFFVIQIVWFLMMLGMMLQFVTNSRTKLLVRSDLMQHSQGIRQYAPTELRHEMRRMNRGAAKTLALWLSLSCVVTALYLSGIIGGSEVILVVMAYYFCDSLCMLFWCPLQKLFMKSRCCVNCRIYGWGYFFDFGLLLLLPSFYTYTLVLFSLALLIKWELAYAIYPERFWAGSNMALRCNNCTEKSCTLRRKIYVIAKRRIRGKVGKRVA